MRTKLEYYRIFYETARYSSFSKAAAHLYISQSAISQCIHQLEEDLNTQLFIRSRRGITLTKEGELLFSKVQNALSSIEQGETILARFHHMESGSLVIAAGDTITTHFLLPYLEKFHQKYPGIRIEMANSYSSHLLELVKEGKAELAFVNLPSDDEELSIKPCLEIHDVFVCSKESDLKNKYSREEISELPLIMLEKNSSSRRYVEKNFLESNIVLEPQIEVAAYELLIRLASIQLGVSCIVKEFSKESFENGVIREIELFPPLPARHIGCAYLKNYPLSKPAEAFLDLIYNKNE